MSLLQQGKTPLLAYINYSKLINIISLDNLSSVIQLGICIYLSIDHL